MRPLLALTVLLVFSGAHATPQAIPADSSWHMQLSGPLETPARQVYNVDLYDTSQGTIADLQRQGRIVLCYFSAGTWEDWRSDAARYPRAALGKPLPDWPGERWLDIRRNDVRALLSTRLDLAKRKGCDGVDPDNVDGYNNDNGLHLSKSQQLDFIHWLTDAAHQRGLLVGLKNAVELLPQLADHVDFAVNESCYKYKECDRYQALRRQGKPVFIAEYGDYDEKLCRQAASSGYRLQFFALALDGIGMPCP